MLNIISAALFSFQLLLQLIVDQLADFSTEPSVFTMFSEQLKKTYFNILIKPDRLGKYVHAGLFSSVSRGAGG